MQAIEDVELPCKFADEGCKYVGARAVLREHLEGCSFRPIPSKIMCQYWKCKEMLLTGDMVNHLRDAHNSLFFNYPTLVGNRFFRWVTVVNRKGNWLPYWSPFILQFNEGLTFLLHAMIEDGTWMFWVCFLGTKEDAQKYEVTMSNVLEGDEQIYNFEQTGRVFSPDKDQKNINTSKDGVLKIPMGMAETLGSKDAEGRLPINIQYKIIRK